MLKFQRDYEEKSVNNNLLLSVMKYQILIQIYIIKIQTILDGHIAKENYWIKNNFTGCNDSDNEILLLYSDNVKIA